MIRTGILRVIVLGSIITCYLTPNLAAKEELQDEVILKSGAIIRGEIIEGGQRDQITIQTMDGNLFVLQMEEIEEVKKEPYHEDDSSSIRRIVGGIMLVGGTAVLTTYSIIIISGGSDIEDFTIPNTLLITGIVTTISGLYFFITGNDEEEKSPVPISKECNYLDYNMRGIKISYGW